MSGPCCVPDYVRSLLVSLQQCYYHADMGVWKDRRGKMVQCGLKMLRSHIIPAACFEDCSSVPAAGAMLLVATLT